MKELLLAFALAVGMPSQGGGIDLPDNTAVNKMDRENLQQTAQAQSQAKPDLQLAAAIRRAIVSDKALSTYGHNVKVLTRDGAVTLRGPVLSGAEKTQIADLVQHVPNVRTVDDRLTVVLPTTSKGSTS